MRLRVGDPCACNVLVCCVSHTSSRCLQAGRESLPSLPTRSSEGRGGRSCGGGWGRWVNRASRGDRDPHAIAITFLCICLTVHGHTRGPLTSSTGSTLARNANSMQVPQAWTIMIIFCLLQSCKMSVARPHLRMLAQSPPPRTRMALCDK